MSIKLLPEDNNEAVEWSTEWVWRLFQIAKRTGTEEEFKEFMLNSDAKVVSSAKFANQVKRFIDKYDLDSKDTDAAIIIASHHCIKG